MADQTIHPCRLESELLEMRSWCKNTKAREKAGRVIKLRDITVGELKFKLDAMPEVGDEAGLLESDRRMLQCSK